ncbi:MAG: DMT family transporter [Caldisericum sp.]
MKSRKIFSIVLLIFSTLIWGSTFTLVKSILRFITDFQLLFLRFGFASILSVFVVIKYRKLLKNPKIFLFLFALGVSLFIAYTFQTAGLKYTTPTKSAFITGLYIVFTPVFSAMYLKEKPRNFEIIALILSFIGLLYLSQINLRSLGSINFGDILTLLCAISFVFQIVLTEKLVKDLPSLLVTSFQMVVSFILSIPFAFLNSTFNLNTFVFISTLFLGVVASFFAIQTESFALKYIDSTEASLIFILEPVFAYLFSFFIFGEKLNVYGIIGSILILTSMFIIAIYNRE